MIPLEHIDFHIITTGCQAYGHCDISFKRKPAVDIYATLFFVMQFPTDKTFISVIDSHL